MNQAITLVPIGTDPKSSLPPNVSRDDDMTRAILTNGREVSAEKRQSLQSHLDRLNHWLGGCDPKETYQHVGALRAVMARNATSEDQEVGVLRTYGNVLSTLPLWAVKRACEDYMAGKVGDGRFAPTPAEIAMRCRSMMARYVEDKAKIERALGITHAAKDPWDEDGLR